MATENEEETAEGEEAAEPAEPAERAEPADREEPEPGEAAGWTARLRARWPWLATFGLLVLLDQATKVLVNESLPGRGLVPLIHGYLELRYARNPGAFFSLGEGLAPELRLLLFGGAFLFATVLILRLFWATEDGQRLLRGGLVLLLSGALGNFIDRLVRGEVTDFLHFHIGDVFHWATFNLADVWIVLGVAFILGDALRPRRRGAASDPEPVEPKSV